MTTLYLFHKLKGAFTNKHTRLFGFRAGGVCFWVPVGMEDRVKVVIHGPRGYFLVRKGHKNFSLLSCGVRRNDDFKAVARKIINKVKSNIILNTHGMI